jgi:hypothetical protein
MNVVVLGIDCRLDGNCSVAAESRVSGGGAGVHAGTVPLVLLNVCGWHDEVTDLPGAAAT